MIDKPSIRPASLLLALVLTGCANEYGSHSAPTSTPDNQPVSRETRVSSYNPTAIATSNQEPIFRPSGNHSDAVIVSSGDANGRLVAVSASEVDPEDGKDKNNKKNGRDNGDKNGKDKEPDKKDKANGDDMNDEDDKDKDKGKDKEKEKEKEEDKWKLLPEGWNFHAQTTYTPLFDAGFGARIPVPTA